jgi:hypothetical protein
VGSDCFLAGCNNYNDLVRSLCDQIGSSVLLDPVTQNGNEKPVVKPRITSYIWQNANKYLEAASLLRKYSTLSLRLSFRKSRLSSPRSLAPDAILRMYLFCGWPRPIPTTGLLVFEFRQRLSLSRTYQEHPVQRHLNRILHIRRKLLHGSSIYRRFVLRIYSVEWEDNMWMMNCKRCGRNRSWNNFKAQPRHAWLWTLIYRIKQTHTRISGMDVAVCKNLALLRMREGKWYGILDMHMCTPRGRTFFMQPSCKELDGMNQARLARWAITLPCLFLWRRLSFFDVEVVRLVLRLFNRTHRTVEFWATEHRRRWVVVGEEVRVCKAAARFLIQSFFL